MADRVTEILARPGFRLVRLQGGGSLKLPLALFKRHPLQEGEAVNAGEYRRRLSAEEARFALEQAARLLERRDRTCRWMEGELLRRGFSAEASGGAVDSLLRLGYLDDRRYAQNALARLEKSLGVMQIRRRLLSDGVPEDLLGELLDRLDPGPSGDAALKLAQKSLRSSMKLDARARYRRAFAALARRGFPPDTARGAIEKALSLQGDGPGPGDEAG